MRKWEQHKTNKWVRSSYVSTYAYAYVAGVLTCYAYVLVRTSLNIYEESSRFWLAESMAIDPMKLSTESLN